jgi:signal transduction histidine kinase
MNPFLLLFVGSLIILLVISGVILWRKFRNPTKSLNNSNFLSAFEKLYTIMATAVTLEDTAQQLADVLAFELGFQAGVLSIVDKKNMTIKRIAVSHTEAGLIGLKLLPIPYKSIGIPLTYERNILIQAIKERKPMVTDDMYDLFVPILPKETITNLQRIMKIKTSFVYPIISKDEVIGTMIFSISGKKDDLPPIQKEAIRRVMEVVGVVLDRVYLYEKLAETSKNLEIANEKLKELDKLKDDFVSIASHELRTPMTAIRSYAWMALNRSDIPLSEKMKKYLTRTLVSTERLINLVNDMLNISRIESGRIEVLPKAFDLMELVSDVVSEVEAKAKEKSLHIKSYNVVLPKVYADPDKVHQVLLNLIGNAMKFTPERGLIELSFMADGQFVDVSVKDSGVGISQEDLPRLFKKFGRLDNSYVAAATSGGTGLGLFICKSLVELMGGRIWVTSQGRNRGTTFTFSLPQASSQILAHPERYTKKPTGEVKALEPASL